jgi:DNA-binding transcriptional LysR family regulator
MKALEAELGAALFLPSGRGVVVSDEGARIYERSKRFLEEYDLLRGKSSEQPRETLRIGSFEVFTSYFIGPLLKTYLPGIEVEVHEALPGRLEEALALKRVDIGITYEPVPRKGIEYVKAASLLMGAFAARGRFQGRDLADIPFVVPVRPLEGAPSGVKGHDAWPDEKIARLIRYRVDLLATGLEIARQGLAAIFIPRFVARLHNESVAPPGRLEALKLPRGPSAVKRDVFIVKRESTAEDRPLRQIARALRDACVDE